MEVGEVMEAGNSQGKYYVPCLYVTLCLCVVFLFLVKVV